MPDRVLPEAWLPKGRKVHRVILHWTAGAYKASAFDRLHYHFLVQGDGTVVQGVRGPGLYLPHTRNLNTGSVGISLCAMAGAVQGRASGRYPLNSLQWERAIQAAADVIAAYDLALTERTFLCHSEVQEVYGLRQRGKWDIDVLPFALGMGPDEIHSQMRRKAAWYLREYHGR
jgi:N-acetyl-anhydromuramyl-L-alanine amidase AmpD